MGEAFGDIRRYWYLLAVQPDEVERISQEVQAARTRFMAEHDAMAISGTDQTRRLLSAVHAPYERFVTAFDSAVADLRRMRGAERQVLQGRV